MTTKLGRDVTYAGKTLPTKLCDLLITWLCDKLEKTYIYNYTIPEVTKLGRVVTDIGEKLPTNSRDLLITW